MRKYDDIHATIKNTDKLRQHQWGHNIFLIYSLHLTFGIVDTTFKMSTNFAFCFLTTV